MYLSSFADLAIYGGAAGGGKSYALLLEPLRHHKNPEFGAVIFRRNSTQVRNLGGLWDESTKIYPLFNGYPREFALEWKFPSGSRVEFAHLEYERSVHDWHGSQIPLIGFDELTHFSERMFFYMLSRNRSTSGVPGYVRATCNPDCDSWVRDFIGWWIDADGYADPKRAGKLRYFVRIDEKIIWADTALELITRYGAESRPKSATFIPSTIYDNKILLAKDPGYLANLRSLSRVDRERLLGDKVKGGNWNIRATAGGVFRREWFPVVDAIPAGWCKAIRFWDRAASKPTPDNPSPDWTRGLLLYTYPNGTFVVADLKSLQDTPGQVETFIKNVAGQDGPTVSIWSQQDPGSAGVAEAMYFVRMLSGYDVRTVVYNKDKLTRAKPVSAQAEAGNVRVLSAPWNGDFFTELENFPDGKHDDIVDVLSGAFNQSAGKGHSILDVM